MTCQSEHQIGDLEELARNCRPVPAYGPAYLTLGDPPPVPTQRNQSNPKEGFQWLT